MKQKKNTATPGESRVYGTATVGSKGQVVIPADARKDLRINPGDQLLVMGRFGRLLGMIKLEELQDFVSNFSEKLDLDEQSRRELDKSHKIANKLLSKKLNSIKRK